VNFDQDKLGLDFVKHRKKYFLVSSILIGLGMLILATLGLNLGVDFESGTFLEVLIENQAFTSAEVRDVLREAGYEPGDVTPAGNQNEFAMILFSEVIPPSDIKEIGNALMQRYGADNISISESTVSPQVARELANQAIIAVILASIGIIIYVAIRFEYRFAIAAVIALFHDALFIIAMFSILRIEVDLTFIAAVLTIVGYSINDTIVIFDRIRENMKFTKLKTFDDLSSMVNKSIVDTLARSINTSLTVVFAAFALYVLGGEGIRNFSFALMLGLLAGAYSSIFIAAQVWLVMKGREMKRKSYRVQQDAS
jgi:preprotein translocase subunit SecF